MPKFTPCTVSTNHFLTISNSNDQPNILPNVITKQHTPQCKSLGLSHTDPLHLPSRKTAWDPLSSLLPRKPPKQTGKKQERCYHENSCPSNCTHHHCQVHVPYNCKHCATKGVHKKSDGSSWVFLNGDYINVIGTGEKNSDKNAPAVSGNCSRGVVACPVSRQRCKYHEYRCSLHDTCFCGGGCSSCKYMNMTCEKHMKCSLPDHGCHGISTSQQTCNYCKACGLKHSPANKNESAELKLKASVKRWEKEIARVEKLTCEMKAGSINRIKEEIFKALLLELASEKLLCANEIHLKGKKLAMCDARKSCKQQEILGKDIAKLHRKLEKLSKKIKECKMERRALK